MYVTHYFEDQDMFRSKQLQSLALDETIFRVNKWNDGGRTKFNIDKDKADKVWSQFWEDKSDD